MSPTEFMLLLFTGLFQLVSMVVLWRCLPEIESLMTQLVGETIRIRQLYEESARKSAEAAATVAKIRRKVMGGGEGN